MDPTSLVPSRLLRRAEAAMHIHDKWGYPCSPRTLAKYAVIGGGPVFRRAGRFPLYSRKILMNGSRRKPARRCGLLRT